VRLRRVLVLLAVVAALAGTMLAIKAVRRGAPEHDADESSAPGSVDAWPAVPRKPA
jgi:hypothetical protein